MAAFFHALPDEVERRPAAWVLATFHRVVQHRRQEMIDMITCVELGVGRALLPALGGQPAPPLTLETGKPRVHVKPAWMMRYEEVNRTR